MSLYGSLFYLNEFDNFMIENNIRDLLFIRVKNLGYHLIRVKIINANGKKTLQIMAERIKDKEMNIKDCTFLVGKYLRI